MFSNAGLKPRRGDRFRRPSGASSLNGWGRCPGVPFASLTLPLAACNHPSGTKANFPVARTTCWQKVEECEMSQSKPVVVTGLLCGLLIGILGIVVFVGACVRDDRLEWSALTDTQFLPNWVSVVVAAAINGGIGACVGQRGSRRVAPVFAIPLLMFLYPLASFVQDPSDSKLWGVDLLVVAIFAPFVWIASRVGQELGKGVRLISSNQPDPFALDPFAQTD
jgi:hypothetical protein